MKDTEQQFFALLRSGLWDSTIDTALFSGAMDWERILKMATMQTVVGVVFDGISNLPSELQPPVTLTRKLYQTVVRIEQGHKQLNQGLSTIIPQMQANGIRPILLKGQGVAQNYSNPIRRQCGDIDIYVGKRDCKKAMEILLRLGAEAENKTNRKGAKHESFYLGAINIELHFLVEKLWNPIYNKRFQLWVGDYFGEDKLRDWSMNGVDITLPPVNFDALYIFKHAFYHFVSGGVGLRQLCDWLMYLHTFHLQIDRQKLSDDLKSFGVLKAWQVFGCIVVDELGLPKEEFPFYTTKYQKQSRKVLNKILEVGNFGQHIDNGKRPSGYLTGKLHTLHIKQKWAFNIFSLFPGEVSAFSIHIWCDGIKNIYKRV